MPLCCKFDTYLCKMIHFSVDQIHSQNAPHSFIEISLLYEDLKEKCMNKINGLILEKDRLWYLTQTFQGIRKGNNLK